MAAVVVVASVAGVGPDVHPLHDGNWVLDRFAYWDSYHFIRIAQEGYFGGRRACCDQAFFPAYPMLLRLIRPMTGGSAVAAGILISVTASGVAAWALWRLALEEAGRRGEARRAVVVLAAAPFGVFLTSVYTESLWLAAALVAWLAGSRQRWWLAGLAGSVASATRVNGLFLGCGLLVMLAGQIIADRRRFRWRDLVPLAPLAVSVMPIAAYVIWLHRHIGSWNALQQAERAGWGRDLVWPWQAFIHGWASIWSAPSSWLLASRALDFSVVVGGVMLVIVVAWQRRWAQLAYLVPSVGVILASPFFTSAGRYSLSWFPAYLVLAKAPRSGRWRWVAGALVGLGLLLTPVVIWLFATRHWVG